MKTILLIGAGKSATVLIDYLQEEVARNNWHLIVADASKELLAHKVKPNSTVSTVVINIENNAERQALIQQADIVISMMPPTLHILIAKDCLAYSKHLLTASYTDDAIKTLSNQIQEKNLLFLYEMGLDPGIDHMSAMELIHKIKAMGGEITSFKSHCGGLVAPESDDNPWHYKISWNPKNVILAGKAGAIYRFQQQTVEIDYQQLFSPNNTVTTPNDEVFGFYPNRNSVDYISLYGLEDCHTFIRTTLRHPDFMVGWKNIIDLQLTNEEKQYDTNGLSIAAFFKQHFDKYGFGNWVSNLLEQKLKSSHQLMENLMKALESNDDEFTEEKLMVDESGNLQTLNLNNTAEQVANNMHYANISLKQLFYLGLDDEETHINKGLCSAAEILQFIVERKLALQQTDKDMVVMLHEIEYTINQEKRLVQSLLQLNGEDAHQTAMAKTVGLPLGIAAVLLAKNQLNITGLHIPTKQAIYQPVLKVLAQHQITFIEKDIVVE